MSPREGRGPWVAAGALLPFEIVRGGWGWRKQALHVFSARGACDPEAGRGRWTKCIALCLQVAQRTKTRMLVVEIERYDPISTEKR
eukprot:CAMPEP_0174950442 /NCGR_PEP_ID=MMETSP1355-20121228/94132_1 /TAXON_ID=464990 /ORGANISM="Hemiselmis tepida, Strain CCMP443" /LENGTH=85 /DNA_ID=CAMNT_0016198051 /DNA_START=1 /DNA_END=255 /DNA_ORIENTATION=-